MAATSKAKIPKAIKQLVWNVYVGEDVGRVECFCCGVTKVTQLNFICGHVQAEANGGKITIDNLRPVCGMCNSSMGTKNMIDFMKTHNLKGRAIADGGEGEGDSETPPEPQPLPPLPTLPTTTTTPKKRKKIVKRYLLPSATPEESFNNWEASASHPPPTPKPPKTKCEDKFAIVRKYIMDHWKGDFEFQKPPNLSKETFIFFRSRNYNLCKRLGVF